MTSAYAWWVGLLLSAAVACEKTDAGGSTSGEAGKGKSLEVLTSEYKALKPPERLEAARSACFIGEACAGHEATALMDAADSDAERAALREAARAALIGQYQTKLAGKAKKPVSVQASGNAGSTLVVKGVCSRFVIEDFVGGAEKKQAKTLGFARLECTEAALTAAADL